MSWLSSILLIAYKSLQTTRSDLASLVAVTQDVGSSFLPETSPHLIPPTAAKKWPPNLCGLQMGYESGQMG